MCQPLCKALRQSTDLKKLEVIETHVHMVQKRYHRRGYDIRSTKHDTHTCTQCSGCKSLETAKANGIKELYDDIAIDNSSVSLFLKCGFVEVLRTTEYVLVKKEL